MMNRIILSVLAVLCLHSAVVRADAEERDDAEIIALIDEFVTEVMRCENVPGMTLTVIRDGQVRLKYM